MPVRLQAAPPAGSRPTPIYTAGALMAFAANSVLCRLALGSARIDAASFTAIRLVSGAAPLLTIAGAIASGRGSRAGHTPAWRAAVALFVYAVTFSYAYLTLTAATGALILFRAVQTTMFAVALSSSERPGPLEGWASLARWPAWFIWSSPA